MPQFLAAAKFPKVALKATGAPGDSAEPHPFRYIYGHIKQLVGDGISWQR